MEGAHVIKKNEYSAFLGRLKREIVSARLKAYQAVNKQLTELYLLIGKGMYEKIEVSRSCDSGDTVLNY